LPKPKPVFGELSNRIPFVVFEKANSSNSSSFAFYSDFKILPPSILTPSQYFLFVICTAVLFSLSSNFPKKKRNKRTTKIVSEKKKNSPPKHRRK
jgi:hypothetical protein